MSLDWKDPKIILASLCLLFCMINWFMSFWFWTCFCIMSFNCRNILITKPNLKTLSTPLLHCVFILLHWSCRLEYLKILEIVHSMAFYLCKVASGVIKLVVIARSLWEESLLFSHVFPFSPANSFGLSYSFKSVTDWNIFSPIRAVIRGEKSRKGYAALLQRHRAAVIIQKRMKTVLARNRMKTTSDAAVVIQSCKNS